MLGESEVAEGGEGFGLDPAPGEAGASLHGELAVLQGHLLLEAADGVVDQDVLIRCRAGRLRQPEAPGSSGSAGGSR